jgi:hypothetical protein
VLAYSGSRDCEKCMTLVFTLLACAGWGFFVVHMCVVAIEWPGLTSGLRRGAVMASWLAWGFATLLTLLAVRGE